MRKGNLKMIAYLYLVCFANTLNFLEFKHQSPTIKQIESKSSTHMEGFILGKGYSNLKESLSSILCFASYVPFENGHYSEVDFTKAQSYSELNKALGLDLELKGGYGYFTGSLGAGFSNQVKQTSTNISFNFFAKSSYRVNINYPYGSDQILNTIGKKAFSSGLALFADVCGDSVITQYEVGSALVMSLVLEFYSAKERNQFQLKLGVGVLGIVELSARIKVAVQDTHINGNIKVKAIQFGGDPTQISRILDTSINDCNLINFENCINMAKKIVEYGSETYPTQLLNKSSFIPLGSFSKSSLSNYGIKKASPVSSDIVESRTWLIEIYKKIDYYNYKFDKLLLYPGISGQSFKRVRDVAEIVKFTYEKLKSDNGGKLCWQSPRDCVDVKEDIESDIVGLFDDEDDLIELVAKIRYVETFNLSFLKGTDTCRIHSTWDSDIILIVNKYITHENSLIFTLNNKIVTGFQNSSNEINLTINKDKFPYVVQSVKISYNESKSIITGTAFCHEGVVQHHVALEGGRITANYYFEKYDEDLY